MKTHVVVVIDSSWTVNDGMVQETIKAINNFVTTLKENNNILSVTVHQFSDTFDTLCSQESHSEVPKLTVDEVFTPSTNRVTPLFDAIGNSIALMGAKKNVYMCVVTHNNDNASKEFNPGSIKKMIDEKSSWKFDFMASKEQLVLDATAIGFNKGILPSERCFAPTKRGFIRLTQMCFTGLEQYILNEAQATEISMGEYNVVDDIVSGVREEIKD